MSNYVLGDKLSQDDLMSIGLYSVVAVVSNSTGTVRVAQVLDLVKEEKWHTGYSYYRVTVGEGLKFNANADDNVFETEANDKGKRLVVSKSGYVSIFDDYGSDGVLLNAAQLDALFNFLKEGREGA